MSQITRCPACATMFKVVADQLKVAQGWVRCGQCGEVFDASLQLAPGEVAGAPDSALTPEAGVEISDADPLQQTPLQSVVIDTPAPGELPDPVFASDAYGFKPPDRAEAEALDSPAPEPEIPAVPVSAQEASEAIAEVSFVRDARSKAFWTSPLVRALLALICLVLLAALALQWVVRQKDVLSAQEPRLAPWLQTMCRPLDCAIRPLRRIESLVIDSASFSKTGADAYRLTFVLKNTGAAALEIPALEVTLTDSQEQALVRRVVMPAQFGATAITLDAYSELAGALFLKVARESGTSSSTQAGLLPVSGYRILAFYP